MRNLWRGAILSIFLSVVVAIQAAALPLCAFTPAESYLTQFNIQGNFQLVDDQFNDDHPGTITGALQANFMQLMDSALFGYRLDGKGRLDLSPTGLDLQLLGSGSFKRYFQGNLFSVGALNLKSLPKIPPELDLTGGLGTGRFRDVTPLAKAIRIQNALLDRGALQGPLSDETLQALAGELSQQGLPLSERLARLAKLIAATGLATGGNLGVRALLQMEEIVTSREEARLCGWDVQASVGLEMSGLPPQRFSGALVVNGHYALVPDPVSQWTASARLVSGFRLFARYSLQASLSYGRRIRQNWRMRLSYVFTRDRTGSSNSTTPLDRQRFSGTILFQLSSGLSLTMNGELIYETGERWPAGNLALQFSYDVL